MIHKACMPVYMNSGKIVADGTGGKIEGSTRGPRGPKNATLGLICTPSQRRANYLQVLIILPKANLVGGTAVVREAGGEDDAELIKTENLAATMEYSQTPRCLSIQ